MNKKIYISLIILMFLIFFGLFIKLMFCSIEDRFSEKEEKISAVVSQDDSLYSKLKVAEIFTVDIDSCEYLVGFDKGAGVNHRLKFVTHKGNCKYCAARKK